MITECKSATKSLFLLCDRESGCGSATARRVLASALEYSVCTRGLGSLVEVHLSTWCGGGGPVDVDPVLPPFVKAGLEVVVLELDHVVDNRMSFMIANLQVLIVVSR